MEVYPLVMTNSLLLNMTIEIVDLPIENGDFPQLCGSLPGGKRNWISKGFEKSFRKLRNTSKLDSK